MRVITLLDPELCLECRFCSFITINGAKTIKCSRKDCDNWGGGTITELAKPQGVTIEVKE